MTATLQSTARTVITEWLSSFETALAAGDVEAVTELFGQDSYWRDLIAFTWNIVTVEGPDGIRDMLSENLERVQPSGFQVADDLGEPTEGGGVAESWIRFETAVGRCVGHLRLKDGLGWTLLTIGVVVGVVWAGQAREEFVDNKNLDAMSLGDPKVFISVVTWAVYSFAMLSRRMMGWTGRRAALLSASGFGIVLLNFIAVSYLTTSHSF
jgi:hypothetical protein